MSKKVSDISREVAATANRLRLLHVDLADESEQVRSEQFSQEIEQALRNILPEQRNAFLEELKDRFPHWDQEAPVSSEEQETTEAAPVFERELNDPDFLIERLAEIASSLPEQEKQSLRENLKNTGLVPMESFDREDHCSQLLKKLLPGVSESEIDPDRLVEGMALLFDFAGRLDPLVWSTWRKVSPRSSIRSPGEFKQAFLTFIKGSRELSDCQDALEKLRYLIAGIISAFGQAGNQFTRYYLSKFSPSQISALVDMEGGVKIWEAKEVRYWRKYVELASSVNDTSLESEIMDQITKYAESLMRGTSR